MKKRFWKIFGITTAALILSLTIIGVIAMTKFTKSDKYVKFDKSRLNEVYTSLTVLDDNGAKLQEPLYIYDYKQIPIDALHDYTYMAFVSVEDKRFFDHNGIDYKRVLGAALKNIKSGGYKEGASTISQQLIKNTHLDNYKTLKRKINEMLLAKELEKNYSKKEILEMYLNTIYFGRNAYGIETASNVYFNKSAAELTVSESAVLAGMIKAPNNYAPDKNADKCKSRRDSVLKLMLEQQVIDNEQYDDAVREEITYCPQKLKSEKTYTYHVMKEACRLLNMTPMQLAQSNFIIETYCNQETQSALNKLANADGTYTKQGVLADMSCIIANNQGGIEACFMRGDTSGDKRQVGSALKPIAVYAPALNERIISQASPVLDEETDFNGYKPTNAGGYNGWTTIKYAVAKSLNIPAVKTLNALGLDTAEKYLNKLGIDGEQNLSLALGNATGGIDPITLTKCYATLANDGKCNDACFIKNIYSENGLIYSRKTQDTRVFQSCANYLMTDMLINTVNNGTAKQLASAKYQIAAKTGTVGNKNGNTDAIIAGYTTSNTFVVWYSGDLENGINGSSAPCKFAQKMLSKIYDKSTPADFTQPNGIIKTCLDKDSLYNDQQMLIAEDGESFAFETVNQPKEVLKKETYDYEIVSEVNGNDLTISLPFAEGDWQLYKLDGENRQKLALEKNRYTAKIETDGEYYAELYVNQKLVYTTPKVKIKHSSENKDEKLPSIFEYWYWK